MILGELAALLAAGSYASSSTVFSIIIKKTTPLLINIQRGVASTVLMFIILLFTSNSVLPDDSLRNYLLLMISGVLGVGIGDSFYFNALNLLGARKTILLETMAPPFTGLISYFYYGTSVSIWGWLGIFVTAYGIYIVVNEAEEAKISRQS
jgi:drug/metabolite transporter (DMT)-like permease